MKRKTSGRRRSRWKKDRNVVAETAAAGVNTVTPGSNGAGAIRPDDRGLPPGIEEIDELQPSSRLPGVLVVIVLLTLIFIAVITYFVARMPAKN
jgi:hypothetical protein